MSVSFFIPPLCLFPESAYRLTPSSHHYYLSSSLLAFLSEMRQRSPAYLSSSITLPLLALLCYVTLLHPSTSASTSLPPLTASYPTFNYYTNASCTTPGTADIVKELNFAIQYPPYDGACHHCIGPYCAPVPYKLAFSNSSGGAWFNMSVYDDYNRCNESDVVWVLTATSSTSQIACTPGTFTYVEDGDVVKLWYTISWGGGSGSGGGVGGSSGVGSGGSESSASSRTVLFVIVAVIVVAVIVVAALIYCVYKRSQVSDGTPSGDIGHYNTLA